MPFGRPLDLRAAATLPGGEMLDGGALVWSSSVHGMLGTGEMLSVDGLAQGSHQLRVTATSPEGLVASNTITIEVGESDLPSQEDQALVRAVFDRALGRDSSGAGGLSAATALAGVGLVLAAVAGGTFAVRCRRLRH